MSMHRACIICGGLFPRKHKIAFCGDVCRDARALQQREAQSAKTRKPKVERGCSQCGGIVVTGKSQRRYCGPACKEAARIDVRRAGKPPRRKGPVMTKAEWDKAYRERNADRIIAKERDRAAKAAAARKARDAMVKVYACHALMTFSVWKSIVRMLTNPPGMAGLQKAEEFRHRYRTDPAFRQKEIQRSKSQKIKRKANILTPLTAKQARAIYAERSTCLYCGCALTEDQKVLDHMDPLSKGGAHCASNLAVACQRCNTRKAARPFIDWILLVPQQRRALVARVYKQKHGAPIEQGSLILLNKC